MFHYKYEKINCKSKLHNCRDELLDCMNEIKIKQDYFLIFGKNEREYIIAIEAICLTSIYLKKSELK